MADRNTIPIVCDMTDAPDTGGERLAEYQQVFAEALLGRERTVEGFRFRFRGNDEVEAWVRDLAAREQTCCAFFTFTVTRVGGEVLLDGTAVDDDTARAVMDEFYDLPVTLAEQGIIPETIEDRFTRHGLQVERFDHLR